MNPHNFHHRSLRFRRPGVTLIEILAGLAVLGVLISSIMIARGRALRQWADADARLQASRAVDELVTTWIAGPESPDRIPVPASGTLAGLPDYLWRTTYLSDPAARQLSANIVRLEVTKDRQRILSLDLLKRLDAAQRQRRSP